MNREELDTLLVREDSGFSRALTRAWGSIAELVPEVGALAMAPLHGAVHKDNVAHTIAVTAAAPARLRVRLVALLHDIGKPPTRAVVGSTVTFHNHEAVGGALTRGVMVRLGYDAAFGKSVAKIVRLSGSTKGSVLWTDSAVRRFIKEVGGEMEDLLDFANVDVTSKHQANHDAVHEEIARLRLRIEEVSAADAGRKWRPVVSGVEIMERYGWTPGKNVGNALGAVSGAQREREARGEIFSADEAWDLLDGWDGAL
jgi:poly(A) polymerase